MNLLPLGRLLGPLDSPTSFVGFSIISEDISFPQAGQTSVTPHTCNTLGTAPILGAESSLSRPLVGPEGGHGGTRVVQAVPGFPQGG